MLWDGTECATQGIQSILWDGNDAMRSYLLRVIALRGYIPGIAGSPFTSSFAVSTLVGRVVAISCLGVDSVQCSCYRLC